MKPKSSHESVGLVYILHAHPMPDIIVGLLLVWIVYWRLKGASSERVQKTRMEPHVTFAKERSESRADKSVMEKASEYKTYIHPKTEMCRWMSVNRK